MAVYNRWILIALFLLVTGWWTLSVYFPPRSPTESTPSFSLRATYMVYGDGCCARSKERACEAALRHGFTRCLSLNKTHIDSDFRVLHQTTLDQKRGAGYWLWKPFLIDDALSHMDDDEILLYADAGAELIASAQPLLDLARGPLGLAVFGLCHHRMSRFCKRDAFVLAGIDTAEAHSRHQFLASFIVVRPTPFAREFIRRWLELSTDPRALTDQPNELGPNLPDFFDHRHDQALLSAVAIAMNVVAHRDPSQWGKCWGRSQHTPLAHSPYGVLFNHDRWRD